MIKKNNLLILTLIILSIILSSCTLKNNSKNYDKITELEKDIKEKDEKISELEKRIKELESGNKGKTSSSEKETYTRVLDTLLLIKNKDMEGLSSIVHPTKGLRFTPYDFIDLEKDKVFKPDEVAKLNENKEVYNWGIYDGKGDPIELNFNDYYKRFVYDYDFAKPHIIGINNIIGKGNTINNIKEAYPNGQFVEFHITGLEPKYEGIDWRSLKLVFEDVNGTLYLVGIIHSEWTI